MSIHPALYLAALLILVAENTEAWKIESRNYSSFLLNVKRSCKASGIFFLYDHRSEKFSSQAKIVGIFKELVALGILSQAMRYTKIREVSNFYFSKNLQSLFVVFVASQANLEEFSAATTDFDMSFHTWLVIFSENGFCQSHPQGNPFHLGFDSKVLVECDGWIWEWYSLRHNSTEVLEVARWTDQLGLIGTTESGYFERRYDYMGKALKIATTENLINGRVMKLFEDVFRELERVMNFTASRSQVVNGFGHPRGLLSPLTERRVDLLLAPMTITDSRLGLIDFTKPLILSPHLIYFRRPDGISVQWSAYFRAFSMSSWLFIVLTLITASLMITFIRIVVDETAVLQISLSYFLENFIRIWGIYCQQGVSEIPSVIPLRMAYFSTLVLTLVLWAIYSASITSYLTVLSPGLPFYDTEGLVKDGSYRLIVVGNTSDQDIILSGKDVTLAKLRPLLKNLNELPVNPAVGFQQVCNERVAFYASEAVHRDVTSRIPCKLSYIETGQSECLAMALTKRSPYLKSINYNLQKLLDNGVMRKLKNRYFRKDDKLPGSSHSPVGLWSVVPLLAIFALGLALSTIVLVLEYFCTFGRRRRIDIICDDETIYI